MIEFIRWSIQLSLVNYQRLVRDRIAQMVMRTKWEENSRFARFVDRMSPWQAMVGYKRRPLRRLFYVLRFPITESRFLSLYMANRLLGHITPYTGPGRYEAMDPRNRLKAEWFDQHSEYASASIGDLEIYPYRNWLFASLDVPWSRQPESWVMEADEQGFIVVLQYENEVEARSAFSGAEYRFDEAMHEQEQDDFGYDGDEALFWREGRPEFNGAFR